MARRSSSASPPREARHGHGHAQELLLEEGHAEGALEDGLQARVRVDVTGSRPARRFR